MSAEQQGKAARRPRRPSEQQEQTPASETGPVTTGDMQEVGAVKPEEVPARRRKAPAEPTVEESPGDQNSG
jgi:hypothetical protein